MNESDCEPIDKILTLAEAGLVELFVSDFAWEEQYKPLLDELGARRKERLCKVVCNAPKVARIEEWVLGEDALGHDDSAEIEHALSGASRQDREQFLSYAALGLDFFVTKDKEHYLKKSVRGKFVKEYGFQLGTPAECVGWINQKGIY